MKLNRIQFLKQMEGKKVDTSAIQQDASLTDKQKHALTQADINKDGKIAGQRELNHVFAGVNEFDGANDRQNVTRNQVTNGLLNSIQRATGGSTPTTGHTTATGTTHTPRAINRSTTNGTARTTPTNNAPSTPAGGSIHPFHGLKPNNGVVGLKDPSALKVHNGNYIVEQDGAVVENMDIRGSLVIKANNVTIRNSRVNGQGTMGGAISFPPGRSYTGVNIENTEISNARLGIAMGNKDGSLFRGGADANQLSGLHIHNVGDGLHLGSDFTLRESRIETKRWEGNHSDGVHIANRGNVNIFDSYIDAGPNDRNISPHDPNNINAAVFMGQDFDGDIDNVHINNSYLNGGEHTYRHWQPKHHLGYQNNPTNSSVRNSWFGPNSRHEPAVAYVGNDGSPVWENNRFIQTGQPIDVKRMP